MIDETRPLGGVVIVAERTDLDRRVKWLAWGGWERGSVEAELGDAPPRFDMTDQDALFVYGTLMPGHLRWAMLAPHALDQRPATVPGMLYDTGQGWPAAVFGRTPTRRRIPGWVVWFPAETLAALLPRLDAMEDVGPVPDPELDPYVRIRVPIDSVTEAWAWHATRTHSRWRVIDAWMDQPEA